MRSLPSLWVHPTCARPQLLLLGQPQLCPPDQMAPEQNPHWLRPTAKAKPILDSAERRTQTTGLDQKCQEPQRVGSLPCKGGPGCFPVLYQCQGPRNVPVSTMPLEPLRPQGAPESGVKVCVRGQCGRMPRAGPAVCCRCVPSGE